MTELTDTLADGLIVGGSLTCRVAHTVSGAVGFHDTWAYAYYPGGGGIGDEAGFHGVFTTQLKSNLSLTQGITIASHMRVAQAVRLAEALNLNSAFTALANYVVHERMTFRSAVATQATMGVSIREAVRFLAFIDFVRSATLGDAMHFAELPPSFAYRAGAAVQEMFHLLATPDSSLLLRIDLPDGFNLDDDALCNFIYNEGMHEAFSAEITHLHPGDNSITTWAINTRTTAVTQYSNYAFNSYALIGRKSIAADDQGLYELVGARDDTTDIRARMAGGFFLPAGGNLAGFKGVYLAVAGQGKNSGATWLLKLEAGDGREYIYQRVSRPNLQTTKFDVGKGLRSRTFAWELIAADGQDFDFDSLEFVPMVSGRRI